MSDLDQDKYEPKPEDYEGMYRPMYCPRGKKDCASISQIISHRHESFLCIGENDGSTRVLEQDKYRECFKNGGIDRMEDCDRRDLQHLAAVISNALAITEATEMPTEDELARLDAAREEKGDKELGILGKAESSDSCVSKSQ